MLISNMRLLTLAVFILPLLVIVHPSIAASPPQPTYGTAVVDGDISEWDLTNDFFGDMYRAGNPSKKLEAKAYLRYDCTKHTLYVLVLTVPGVNALAQGWESSAWGAINSISNKVFTGNSGNPPNPPQFAWVNQSPDKLTAQGYEASFIIIPGTPTSPAFYTLLLHIEVYDDGGPQTAAFAGFPSSGATLELICSDSASITLVKSFAWTTGDGSHVGDVVTFTYTVTNTGTVTLNPVTVVDNQLGPITLLDTSLDPGETTTGTATLTLTQALLDIGSQTNIATATGTPLTGPNVTNTTTKTVTFVTTPAMELTKSYEWTTGDGSSVGDIATFTYTVTNTGNVTLNPVSVNDNKLGPITLLDTNLAPGETTTGTATLTLTQALLDAGSQTNTATATGTPPTGPNITRTSTKTVTFITTPAMELTKSYEWTTGDGSNVGDVATFTYTVTNIGNVTLNPVSVSDDKLGPITLSDTNLAPGETTTGTATLTVTQALLDAGSQTNIATATGTPPTGPNITRTTSKTILFGGVPAILIVKSFEWTTGNGSSVGDVVTFTYTVTNTGSVTLNPVSVSDDKLGSITLLDTNLAPGETTTGTATLTLTQALLDAGSQINTSTVTGTPPSGPNVTDTSTRTVVFLTTPVILIVKSFEWTTGNGSNIGDVVTYTYTVTNTGNVTLNPVSVSDDKLGPITLLDTNLAPGETTTGTATLTLTQALLDAGSQTNIATVTGTPPSGPNITSTSTRIVVFITTPAILIVKTFEWTTGDGSNVGDVVTYTYTVTNTGNVTLNPVSVSDDKLGPITLLDTNLAPGETTTGTAALTLTQTLLDIGSQINTATVTAVPPIGGSITDASTRTVDFIQLPNISIVKSISVDGGITWLDASTPPGPSVLVGSSIQWRYVITNIGNVTLTNVTLIDDQLGPITLSTTTLAPQGSVTAYASGTAIEGQHCNIGDVTATPPIGPIVETRDCTNYFGYEFISDIRQACAAFSTSLNHTFLGYNGMGNDVITAIPGVLVIEPGNLKWSNFVAAAQVGIDYTIKNVYLQKETPEVVQCGDIFKPSIITQQGTSNIRLWWPLMYEIPGTKWTLRILYGTGSLFDDDGIGPHTGSYVHNAVWTWTLGADIQSMKNLVDVFHELPFGLDEVPLISDEILYQTLQILLSSIQEAINAGDLATAGTMLADFELLVNDACIVNSPLHPNPTGSGTGIANTTENPACCKLLIDAEYVAKTLGAFVQKK